LKTEETGGGRRNREPGKDSRSQKEGHQDGGPSSRPEKEWARVLFGGQLL